MPNFRDYLMSEDNLDEVLSKADPAAKWIKDFVKSDNPKFEGKSKKERIKMALGAYYAKQRNEEVESVDESARERLARMMQDKAMVKNPPKIPTPAERRAKEQEKAKKEGMAEARDPSKMSTKAIKTEMDQIEKKDYDSTSKEERDRHDTLSKEHRYRTPNVPSGMASGYEVDKAVKRGMAKKAKAIQTQEEVESIDEISQELKTAYTQKAKAQVKELEPFAKKKSEYRDLAKNLIAKRQKGIAKANEELVDDSLDEQIHHWSVHHGEGTIKNYTDKKTAKAEYDRVKQGRYGKYAKLVPVKQEDMKKLKSYADAVFKKYGAGGGIEEGK